MAAAKLISEHRVVVLRDPLMILGESADPANYQKSVDEMLRLIAVLGYRVELKVSKEVA